MKVHYPGWAFSGCLVPSAYIFWSTVNQFGLVRPVKPFLQRGGFVRTQSLSSPSNGDLALPFGFIVRHTEKAQIVVPRCVIWLHRLIFSSFTGVRHLGGARVIRACRDDELALNGSDSFFLSTISKSPCPAGHLVKDLVTLKHLVAKCREMLFYQNMLLKEGKFRKKYIIQYHH